MDWEGLFDAIAGDIGRSDLGIIMRADSPQLDRQFKAIEKRNFMRWKEKQSGNNANQQKHQEKINIEIAEGHFVTSNGYPLDLQCIINFTDVNRYLYDDDYVCMTRCVGASEDVEYNGLDMIWRCAPEPNEIRNILMKFFNDSNLKDHSMDCRNWDDFRLLFLDEFTFENELKILFENDITVMARIEGETEYKEISIKPSVSLGMGQMVKVDICKKNFNQFYNQIFV